MICFLCIRGTSRLCLYLYFSFTTCVSVNFHLVSPSLKDNSKDGRFPLSSASREGCAWRWTLGSCYGSWWLVSGSTSWVLMQSGGDFRSGGPPWCLGGSVTNGWSGVETRIY
ncbi:unnamed protein product [Brassica oleracea var. botrytis]|uniref:(rape) hypothetical protein n=2 Tax=Brassica TaxID=3705 RepID=A0A816MQD7_BRANA|nr:unnamed protein product [Brassica napus]